MKIRIDMQGTQTASRHRGIGRYCVSLTREFLQLAAPGHRVELLFNAALDGIDETIASLGDNAASIPRAAFGPVRDTSMANPAHDHRRTAAERILALALDREAPDVVWLSSVVEGFGDDAVVPIPLPRGLTVATLYDLIPLHDPSYLGQARAREWYESRLEVFKHCDLLLAISDWARHDAIERLGLSPERVVTIGAGVQPHFAPGQPGQAHERLLAQHGIDRPFVLYSGGFDKRKNVVGLIRAFAALPPSLRDTHQLVIVGRPDEPYARQLQETLVQLHLPATEVVLTGYVSDPQLVQLYQSCALFVFPSEREGFGLTPLEAMACGAAVIVNDATSLPEVVGNADALFDATSIPAMAAKIAQFLADPVLLQRARDHGLARARNFTWQAVAERALRAIEAAAARQPSPCADVAIEAAGQPITSESRARREAPTVAFPEYRLDAANVVGLSPWIRQWPGKVSWTGPLPAKGPEAATDLYRLGGYGAIGQTGSGSDWIRLLEAEGIPVHSTEGGVAGSSCPHASAGLRHQRVLENEIATAVARWVGDDDLARIADAIARLRPFPPVRWLVDVTAIARKDIGTGVQRVVRSILGHWLKQPPEGVRIEPVTFRQGRYHHAHAYACDLLGLPDQPLPGDIVGATPNDVFVGLDWAMDSLPSSEPLLKAWRRAGVRMHFVVHDVLPMTMPDAFHPHARARFETWLQSIAMLADGLHCISRQTASDVAAWLTASGRPNQFGKPPAIDVFPLGVDAPRAPQPLPEAARKAAARQPTFLMVGTIEPRKGHEQVLDAFELLWKRGVDVNLLIVGRRGWLVQRLTERLAGHQESNRRLFWLEDADDGTLEAAYATSTALLAASYGEGFGLPLVEAAHRQLPVIARDLPVFRETMGEYPAYFTGNDAGELADHLWQWLLERPQPGAHPCLPSWEESARSLQEAIASFGGSQHTGYNGRPSS